MNEKNAPTSPKKRLARAMSIKQGDYLSSYRQSVGEQGKGKIQQLKQKVSQMRLNSAEGNNKYLEKIMALEKEIKQSHDKVNRLELEMKIKDNNIRYQEKQLKNKKDKIGSLEDEIIRL